VDLRWSGEQAAFRAEARAWLEANVPRGLPRGVLGTSALLTGLARRMLDLTVGYVSRREQFGVPVGSFQTAIQCHGAIGYTTEYDLHLYAKRAWALASAWGDPAWHRARLATFLALPRGDDPPKRPRLGVADG
jgi:alkylation response protein AidB-like acyl-CoA dehydrogenase